MKIENTKYSPNMKLKARKSKKKWRSNVFFSFSILRTLPIVNKIIKIRLTLARKVTSKMVSCVFIGL